VTDRRPVTGSGGEDPTPENSIVLGPGSCPEPVRYSERDLAATRISKGPDETGQSRMTHSHWYRRNLTAEHVGEIFSSDPRALPSLPGFLAAYPLSLQTRWSLADIFNFLAEADPHHVASWVPRLFPVPGAPTWHAHTAEPHVLLEAVAAAASPPGSASQQLAAI
jgi:hypothetical protein